MGSPFIAISLYAIGGAIILTAGVVTSFGVLWVKIVRPLGKLVKLLTQAVPLLITLTTVFKDNPSAFEVLYDIVAQFRTDDGSTLRDVIDRIEKAVQHAADVGAENREAAAAVKEALDIAAEKAGAAARQLEVGVEVGRQLAEQDRATLHRLDLLVDHIDRAVKEGAESGRRLEQGAGLIADNLAADKRRATEAQGGEAGAAADAAVVEEEGRNE